MKQKCIIIGGGIIGLMSARELFLGGWEPIVLERNKCGMESSWAGGGILSPLHPWEEHQAVQELALFGQQKYPEFAEQIKQDTGIDPEWFPSGMLYIAPEKIDRVIHWLKRKCAGYTLESFFLHNQNFHAVFVPSISQIRPPRLLKGLKKWLLNNGVEIIEHSFVTKIHSVNGRFQRVHSTNGVFEADCVVLSAGAWSRELLRPFGIQFDVKPVKGQMILFGAERGILPSMRIYQSRYVIPRKDGFVVAGSTIEETGFINETSEQVKKELQDMAVSLCPQLRDNPILHHWSGLRPGTNRSTPYVCNVNGLEGVYLNTGHFRNGLTLAPGSAKLLYELINDCQPSFDINSFQM